MISPTSEAIGESGVRISPAPKKKSRRPCDACRRRKVRCGGNEIPGSRCFTCTTYRLECTYLEAPKKRSVPEAYVRNLERRLEQMEKLLHKIRPDTDFSKELSGTAEMDELVTTGQSHPQNSPASVGVHTPDGDDGLQSSDDEFATLDLTSPWRRLSISCKPTTSFGKSSGPVLIRAAVEMRSEFYGTDGPGPSPIDEEANPEGCRPPHRRPEFWGSESWGDLKLDDPKPHYHFPDPDLLPSLVDNYFAHMNLIFPLLHRPTFEQSLADNLHLRDARFGGVVLLVAAVGARFSSDPRVRMHGTDPTPDSVGSRWFHQVQIVPRLFSTLPSLYDLQIYCLSVMFLQSSAAVEPCWIVTGIGIRLSQAIGAHRKRVYGKTPTVVDELWKRAFWVLVALDRLGSSGLGRPCTVQNEDIDLEFPAECDDEYWTATDTNPAFTQPPGKPSKISFFVSYLKLSHILASTLQTIYSIKKPKFSPTPIRGNWEQSIVAELDSALNSWYDSVPDHLRWDPHREDAEFLQQSTVLYASYYSLQISVHRPFVSSSQKPSALSFPSLAICMNAARSCSRLVKYSKERLWPILHHLTMPTFTAGVVLLFNIWGGKWAEINIGQTGEMEDIRRCVNVLGMAEKSWKPAGMLRDILCELAYIGDLPSPNRITGHSSKRERDSDDPLSAGSTSPYTSSPTAGGPQIIAAPTNGFREPIVTQDLGNSSRYATVGEINVGPGPSTAGIRERPPVSSQEQSPIDKNADENTIVSARGVPMDTDAIGTSLFSIDPQVYGDMVFNLGCASAIAPGMGQQAFGGSVDDGSSNTTFGQERPELRPQTHWQPPANPPTSYDDGGRGMIPNPDGSIMWTNAPHGFAWEDWGTYAHNFSNMTRQH